ncbi:MAG: hypothetical protein AAF547_08805 [Actinomycetota bacterium]
MRTTQSINRRRPVAVRLWLAAGAARTRLRERAADDTGAVAIEYVIVAIALLAIAGAIAAALTALGNDAVSNIPDTVSG